MGLKMEKALTPDDEILLQLLDEKYINKGKSFISGEENENAVIKTEKGTVFLNLDMNKIPNADKIASFLFKLNITKYAFMPITEEENLFEFNSRPNKSDGYYIVYDPFETTCLWNYQNDKGCLTTFAVKHDNKIYNLSCQHLRDELELLAMAKHPKLEKYRAMHDRISELAVELSSEFLSKKIAN
jgi:hypothetical protein